MGARWKAKWEINFEEMLLNKITNVIIYPTLSLISISFGSLTHLGLGSGWNVMTPVV